MMFDAAVAALIASASAGADSVERYLLPLPMMGIGSQCN